jgi:hypothetical protein
MKFSSFFNVMQEMAIILAIITFALGFLYLYMNKGETPE